MSKYTNAQCYAGFIGILFVAAGIVGLTAIDGGSTFSHGGGINGGKLLMFEGNGWSSVLTIAIGALGLLAATRPGEAKAFAGVAGVVFLAFAIWGIIDDNTVANLFPVNRADNVLNLGLGVLGLVIHRESK